jgi:hypothetical protein
MRRSVVAVVGIVVFGIIGYAVAGYAYAATRQANADSSLNTVISHQNNLNSTFKDIDKQFNSLSDFTKIATDIDAYYKPRVDAFNAEMAKATAT